MREVYGFLLTFYFLEENIVITQIYSFVIIH